MGLERRANRLRSYRVIPKGDPCDGSDPIYHLSGDLLCCGHNRRDVSNRAMVQGPEKTVLDPTAWTSIYVLISFAAARVAPIEGSQYAMAFWALQIALNTLWTPVFFGLRRLRGALPIMAGLWLAVAGATWTHFQFDFWAGLAFVPYLTWVTVAGALNLEIARLNPDQKPIEPSKIEV